MHPKGSLSDTQKLLSHGLAATLAIWEGRTCQHLICSLSGMSESRWARTTWPDTLGITGFGQSWSRQQLKRGRKALPETRALFSSRSPFGVCLTWVDVGYDFPPPFPMVPKLLARWCIGENWAEAALQAGLAEALDLNKDNSSLCQMLLCERAHPDYKNVLQKMSLSNSQTKIFMSPRVVCKGPID